LFNDLSRRLDAHLTDFTLSKQSGSKCYKLVVVVVVVWWWWWWCGGGGGGGGGGTYFCLAQHIFVFWWIGNMSINHVCMYVCTSTHSHHDLGDGISSGSIVT
jgi:hypothetical protein